MWLGKASSFIIAIVTLLLSQKCVKDIIIPYAWWVVADFDIFEIFFATCYVARSRSSWKDNKQLRTTPTTHYTKNEVFHEGFLHFLCSDTNDNDKNKNFRKVSPPNTLLLSSTCLFMTSNQEVRWIFVRNKWKETLVAIQIKHAKQIETISTDM